MQDIEDKERYINTGRLIHILSNQMKRRNASEAVGDDGLTTMQKHVLKHILLETMHREVYQKDIEEKFCVTRSTVSKVLKGMESKGLLRRESVSSDARLKRLVLTEEGREINANAAVERIELENRIRNGLSDEEFHTLMHLLKRVADNMLEE